MKRLFLALVVVMAINFAAVAGALGWMYNTGRLDRKNIAAIKAVLFPPPPPPTTKPADAVSTTQPALRLEELLAKTAGRSPAEQLEFIRQSFESHMAQLERAQREMLHLQSQVMFEKQKLATDRAAFEEEKKKLASREQEATRLAADKGFQDSLALYQSMAAKQVKTIFMTLDDASVLQYLSAMEPRAAARITKEFKTPEETERIKRLLEKMRLAQATTKE